MSENGADTSSYAFATAEDATDIEFPVFARDEDLDSIAYSLSGEPMGWDAGGSRALGNVTFTPGGGIQGLVPGTVTFTVRVRDEYNRTDTASVTVTVTGETNEAPIASNNRDFPVTQGESMSFNLDGFFSDDGGDANLDYALGDTPQGIMAPIISISGSDLTINASSADTGEYTFSVRATDAQGLFDTTTGWTITVSSENLQLRAPASGESVLT